MNLLNVGRRHFWFALVAVVLLLGACSGSSEFDVDAALVRPAVLARMEDPDSSFYLEWVRLAGMLPENDALRQYVMEASDEEIERAARGACEAAEESLSVPLGIDGDIEGLAFKPVGEWQEGLGERNQSLADAPVGVEHLFRPFLSATCPELDR